MRCRFDALLADLNEVELDEDDDADAGDLDDLDLDGELESLFGGLSVDTSGSIESSGMHPGDAGRT